MKNKSNWHTLRPSRPMRLLREIGYTITGRNAVGECIYASMLTAFGLVMLVCAGAILG